VGDAPARPAVQMAKLDRHHRRLERIETEVPADQAMVILGSRPVGAQASQPFGAGGVVGDDHAAVAGRRKILGGIERQATVVTDGPDTAPAVLGTDRLRSVLDYHESVSL